MTVLVCAKNELNNLKELLPDLAIQSQKQEILIVDDFSTDNSLNFLHTSAKEYPNLTYQKSSKNITGKKQALMDGFAQVDEGLILLTDADCRPASINWAQSMAGALGNHDLVLGYGPYEKRKGFLNRWIRYEAILTGIQYLSFSLNGRPYMGVGRNVLYRKSLVQKGEALKENLRKASGDDDLLINRLANKNNCAIQIHPESWTISKANTTWKSYFNQKRRHMSTASSYKFSDQLLLLLFSISWILFYFSLVIILLRGFWSIAFILLVTRLLSTYLSTTSLFPKLDGKDCLAHWWYLDPLTAIYFSIFSIFAIIPQRNTW